MAQSGEVRQVLRSVFAEGPTTWRCAATVAQVGYDCARRTVENMVRVGELVRCGEEMPPGSRVRCGVYELATAETLAKRSSVVEEDLPKPWAGIEEVAAVVLLWPLDRPP